MRAIAPASGHQFLDDAGEVASRDRDELPVVQLLLDQKCPQAMPLRMSCFFI
jgi:hypothetical protein